MPSAAAIAQWALRSRNLIRIRRLSAAAIERDPVACGRAVADAVPLAAARWDVALALVAALRAADRPETAAAHAVVIESAGREGRASRACAAFAELNLSPAASDAEVQYGAAALLAGLAAGRCAPIALERVAARLPPLADADVGVVANCLLDVKAPGAAQVVIAAFLAAGNDVSHVAVASARLAAASADASEALEDLGARVVPRVGDDTARVVRGITTDYLEHLRDPQGHVVSGSEPPNLPNAHHTPARVLESELRRAVRNGGGWEAALRFAALCPRRLQATDSRFTAALQQIAAHGVEPTFSGRLTGAAASASSWQRALRVSAMCRSLQAPDAARSWAALDAVMLAASNGDATSRSIERRQRVVSLVPLDELLTAANGGSLIDPPCDAEAGSPSSCGGTVASELGLHTDAVEANALIRCCLTMSSALRAFGRFAEARLLLNAAVRGAAISHPLPPDASAHHWSQRAELVARCELARLLVGAEYFASRRGQWVDALHAVAAYRSTIGYDPGVAAIGRHIVGGCFPSCP